MRKIVAGFAGMLILLSVAVVLFLRLPWISTDTVMFRNGDVQLVGTLAVPRWRSGPFPAAVVVHGSADLPRWIYWSYVRNLVPHGLAVLIYDKRGVGDSAGKVVLDDGLGAEGTYDARIIARCREFLDIMASDAAAALEWAKNQAHIDANRAGFAGPSQAGWVMPLAVEQSAGPAFIVAVAGPAVSCGLEDWYSQLTGEYVDYPALKAPTPYQPGELSVSEIERLLDDYDGPDGYDPLPVLQKLRVPTLWLLGGQDLSVPTARSVENLNRLIADGAPFEVIVYPDGNHRLARGTRQWPRIDFWSDMRKWLTLQAVLVEH